MTDTRNSNFVTLKFSLFMVMPCCHNFRDHSIRSVFN